MRTVLSVVLVSLSLAACTAGTPTSTALPTRIEITMNDLMRFEPESMSVPADQPVTFVVTNTGQVDHEMYLGDAAAQDAHEVEMTSGGAAPHEHSNSILLGPGEIGELVYTFAADRDWLAGCHVPGHWAAGMKAAITVV